MSRLNIADDLTRLRGEMKVGYAERQAFVKGIRQEVATMRQGFRRANDERVREVAALLAGFRREHKERARTVMAQRRETREDMARAHQAWFGPSPAELRAMAAAERRAKAEADRLAQEAAERDRLAQEAAERDRMAALAMAKEEAVRQQAALAAEEAKGTEPGPKGHAKKK